MREKGTSKRVQGREGWREEEIERSRTSENERKKIKKTETSEREKKMRKKRESGERRKRERERDNILIENVLNNYYFYKI